MTDPLPPLVYMGQTSLMRVQDHADPDHVPRGDFQTRLQVLKRCMTHYQGIGIAAPQIGWNARVFCMGIEDRSDRYPEAELMPIEIWINPIITDSGDEMLWAWEGCLSVPGMRGWVRRPANIRVSGLDETGGHLEKEFTGFAARVFQHEYDHLDGVLFPRRIFETRFLIPEISLAQQDQWPAGWPSAGSRRTAPGELSALE